MGSTVVKTVKLSTRQANALARAAKARGCTESALIREGIEAAIRDDGGLDMSELIGPGLGIARGPRDLSIGRKHLVNYGRSRDR